MALATLGQTKNNKNTTHEVTLAMAYHSIFCRIVLNMFSHILS